MDEPPSQRLGSTLRLRRASAGDGEPPSFDLLARPQADVRLRGLRRWLQSSQLHPRPRHTHARDGVLQAQAYGGGARLRRRRRRCRCALFRLRLRPHHLDDAGPDDDSREHAADDRLRDDARSRRERVHDGDAEGLARQDLLGTRVRHPQRGVHVRQPGRQRARLQRRSDAPALLEPGGGDARPPRHGPLPPPHEDRAVPARDGVLPRLREAEVRPAPRLRARIHRGRPGGGGEDEAEGGRDGHPHGADGREDVVPIRTTASR